MVNTNHNICNTNSLGIPNDNNTSNSGSDNNIILVGEVLVDAYVVIIIGVVMVEVGVFLIHVGDKLNIVQVQFVNYPF